eukprot:scaffold75109_cov20-Tisochrysis_lutea.AAC.1
MQPHLCYMLPGSSLEEGLDWGVSTSPSHASPSLQPTTSPRLHHSPGAGLALLLFAAMVGCTPEGEDPLSTMANLGNPFEDLAAL